MLFKAATAIIARVKKLKDYKKIEINAAGVLSGNNLYTYKGISCIRYENISAIYYFIYIVFGTEKVRITPFGLSKEEVSALQDEITRSCAKTMSGRGLA